jgi:hypothetical protein
VELLRHDLFMAGARESKWLVAVQHKTLPEARLTLKVAKLNEKSSLTSLQSSRTRNQRKEPQPQLAKAIPARICQRFAKSLGNENFFRVVGRVSREEEG